MCLSLFHTQNKQSHLVCIFQSKATPFIASPLTTGRAVIEVVMWDNMSELRITSLVCRQACFNPIEPSHYDLQPLIHVVHGHDCAGCAAHSNREIFFSPTDFRIKVSVTNRKHSTSVSHPYSGSLIYLQFIVRDYLLIYIKYIFRLFSYLLLSN